MIPDDFGRRLALLKEKGWPLLGGDGDLHRRGPPAAAALAQERGPSRAGGAMLALVALAEQVPGGLDILMGRDLGVMAQGRE